MSKISNVKCSKLFRDDDEDSNSSCYLLIADYETREVSTNCGDFYYDLSINFDDFIKFAKQIEEQDKIYNKGRNETTHE